MSAAGLLYRVASVGLFLAFTYVFLLDQTRYLNHFYVVSLLALLLAFMPAHRSFSLDARLGLVRRSEFVPAWSLFLLRAQVAIVYFYAGIAKLDPDWLRGDPMGAGWRGATTSRSSAGSSARRARALFSWGGLALRPPDRAPPGLAAHAALRLRGRGAVPPDEREALLDRDLPVADARGVDRLLRPGLAAEGLCLHRPHARRDAALFPARRLVLALGGAYLALQLAVPLRHHLYPGPVAWTEEGHRFSWRMKLRDKEASVRLTTRDPKTGETWTEPLGNLTTKQRRTMAAHPDMILQYVHHLAEIYREEGRDVEITPRPRCRSTGARPADGGSHGRPREAAGRPAARVLDPAVRRQRHGAAGAGRP